MRSPVILFILSAVSFSLAGAPLQSPTPPITIRDSGVNTPEEFAGDWLGYWLRGKKLAAKTNTIFRLTPKGEWFIVLDGKTEKAGSFRLSDSYLMLKRDKKESEELEEPELLAHLIDRNGFLIRATSQPEIAIVYRRLAAIPPVTQDEIRGEWRLFEENPAWEKRRAADFGFQFDGRGNYAVVKYDRNRPVPEGAEKGTYVLSGDEIILNNNCADKDSSWTKLRFFKVFDELILNTPDSTVYAERQ